MFSSSAGYPEYSTNEYEGEDYDTDGSRSNSNSNDYGNQYIPDPNGSRDGIPQLGNPSSILIPRYKPGRCQSPAGNTGCISLGPDSSQCSTDGDCQGTKKCCFYACPPYKKVGVCEVPALF